MEEELFWHQFDPAILEPRLIKEEKIKIQEQ
jgi:hypothetical protein